MAERPRDACSSTGVGHFEAKFYVKWLRFASISACGPLDGRMVILQLPLEVFTQRNFAADFIRLKLNFIQKYFEPPFGNLGVTYALHLYSSLESPWSTCYSS